MISSVTNVIVVSAALLDPVIIPLAGVSPAANPLLWP
jgi:hypothetical protein